MGNRDRHAQLTFAMPRRSHGPPGRKYSGIMAAYDFFAPSGTETSFAYSSSSSSSTEPFRFAIISTYDEIIILFFSKVFGFHTTPASIELFQFGLATGSSRSVWPAQRNKALLLACLGKDVLGFKCMFIPSISLMETGDDDGLALGEGSSSRFPGFFLFKVHTRRPENVVRAFNPFAKVQRGVRRRSAAAAGCRNRR